MTISAFPLAWPEGWPRHSGFRELAKFETKKSTFDPEQQASIARRARLTVADGIWRVTSELGRMGLGADDVVISTNVRLRLDGLPRSKEPEPPDPGVAVYWQTKNGARKVMAIDRYTRVADNLAAVAATLEALRGISRWGGGQILDRAFSGFTALPAPGKVHARGWREIMNFTPTEIVDLETLKARYRVLSSMRHPDKGGTDAAMSELNWALAQAREALA